MIALNTLMQKTVDQLSDIFSLRGDIGFQTWSNREIKIKYRSGKTCYPTLLKSSPILPKYGMIALKTLIHSIVDQIFDIFLENRDFGPGSSRNLNLCNFLNNFLSFTHQPPP